MASFFVGFGLVVFFACGDDATSVDAGGGSDAGARSDAGADAGSLPDAGATDAGPALCDLGCPENYACVDGECINTCGSDAEALRAVIAPHLEVGFGFCDQGAAAQAIPRDTLHELYADGARLSVGYRADTTGPFTEIFAVTAAIAEGATLVPNPRLEMGHSDPILFGYTAGETGALCYTRWGSGSPMTREYAAPGLRDFTLLGVEAFLLAGDGLGELSEGPGVYFGSPFRLPRLFLTNAGVPRTVVARTDYAIVGADPPGRAWPDGTDTPRAFIVPLADLSARIDALGDPSVIQVTTLSAELADLGSFGIASIARNTHSGEVTSVDVVELELYPELGLSEPVRWVTGPGFDRFTKAGYGAVLFHHANGTWLVRPRE